MDVPTGLFIQTFSAGCVDWMCFHNAFLSSRIRLFKRCFSFRIIMRLVTSVYNKRTTP